MKPSVTIGDPLTRVVREEWRALVAALVRDLRDLELAEDAVQEAVVAAMHAWPVSGVPERPGAWLLTTARRKAIDRLRRERRYVDKLELLIAAEARDAIPTSLADPARAFDETDDVGRIGDDQLALILACTHPALSIDAQVALALRELCGLTTTEIASAFLVPEPTMAQRLVRAKRKIRAARIPFSVPNADVLPSRVNAAMGVVYLLFNEGYSASGGDHTIRAVLCVEAVRLGRVLATVLPEEPEVLGLLALLLLTEARRTARLDDEGDLVPLDAQDRSRWNKAMIDDGLETLSRAAALDRTGPYQLQAAIAAIHDLAPDPAQTDWAAITTLYGELERMVPSPTVSLNRAVAVGMADGPDRGLAMLARAEVAPIAERHLFHVARAEFLLRAGRVADARIAFAEALRRAPTAGEQRHLTKRLAQTEALGRDVIEPTP